MQCLLLRGSKCDTGLIVCFQSVNVRREKSPNIHLLFDDVIGQTKNVSETIIIISQPRTHHSLIWGFLKSITVAFMLLHLSHAVTSRCLVHE